MKQVIEVMDLLDDAYITGDRVAALLKEHGVKEIKVKKITGEKGSTDFIKIKIPGTKGKTKGGDAPTRRHRAPRRYRCSPRADRVGL